jgi:glutathione peroxidase
MHKKGHQRNIGRSFTPEDKSMRHASAILPFVLAALCTASDASRAADCPALLNREIPRLQDEKPQNLCQYKGQVVLVVNTASQCGYTPQYEGLEALYRKYRDRGLVVLGFPRTTSAARSPARTRTSPRSASTSTRSISRCSRRPS